MRARNILASRSRIPSGSAEHFPIAGDHLAVNKKTGNSLATSPTIASSMIQGNFRFHINVSRVCC